MIYVGVDIGKNKHAAAAANIRGLESLFHRASGGKLGREAAEACRDAARRSLSLPMDTTGEEFVIPQIIDALNATIAQIAKVEKRMEEEPRPLLAAMLGSIKGAGRIQPLAVAAEIGDPERFAGPDMAKKALAHAGCEPRVRKSGKWKGKTKMSKRGSPTLRNAPCLLATTIRLHSPYFNSIYKRQIARGKHHNVALGHVIRKIVEIIEPNGKKWNGLGQENKKGREAAKTRPVMRCGGGCVLGSA